MAENTAASGAGIEFQPISGCFVRLGWILGANILLGGLAILIARSERWTFTAMDVAFWLILPSAIGLRYLDWKRFSGRTADGLPATARDARRHATWLVGSWSTLWIAAQTLELG
jgi:hypothetical protein